MSAASATNFDVGQLISNYYLLFIVVLAASALLFTVFNYIFYRLGVDKTDNKELKFIKNASLIGIAAMVCSLLTASEEQASMFIVFAVLMVWIFVVFKKLKIFKLNLKILQWAMLLGLPLTICCTVFFDRLETQMGYIGFAACWAIITVLLIVLQQLGYRLFAKQKPIDHYTECSGGIEHPIACYGLDAVDTVGRRQYF